MQYSSYHLRCNLQTTNTTRSSEHFFQKSRTILKDYGLTTVLKIVKTNEECRERIQVKFVLLKSFEKEWIEF